MAIYRNYKNSEIKALLVRSGNRCPYPGCANSLVDDDNVVLFDICHIYEHGEAQPRHNPTLSKAYLDSYDNIILFCKICHKKVDSTQLSHIHTVEWLQELKKNHETGQRHPATIERMLEKFSAQLMEQIAEEMPSLLSGLEDPTQRTYQLQRIEGSTKTLDRRIVKRGATYTAFSILLLVVGLFLTGWQGIKTLHGYPDFNPEFGYVLFCLGFGALIYCILNRYNGYASMLLFAENDAERLIAGRYTIRSGDTYHRYRKGFTCGFPGCKGQVNVYAETDWFAGKNEIRGRCAKNQEDHTYIIKGDNAYYRDFKKEEILNQLRRIRQSRQ